MRKLLLTTILLVFQFVSFASEGTRVADDARTCTTSFFQALTEKNTTSLRQLLAMDFGVVSFDGQLVDGKTLIEAIDAGYLAIEKSSPYSLQVRTYGEASVITGFWNSKGVIDGSNFATEVVFSAMCVKQAGTWKLASIQFTPLL